MRVGLLEAFGILEQYGKSAMDAGILTAADIIFIADARKRKGCRSVSSTLVAEERTRVIEFGVMVKNWKDGK